MDQEHQKQQQRLNEEATRYASGEEVAKKLQEKHGGGQQGFPPNPIDRQSCMIGNELYVFYQNAWTKAQDLPVDDKDFLPF